MNYFNYVKNVNTNNMMEIYQAVQDLKGYAITIYNGAWEDALDKSFFHIMENYDASKGDLEHYATRVVGTILLNNYSHEVAHDIVLDTSLEEKSFEMEQLHSVVDVIFEEEEEEVLSSDLEDCIHFLTPSFVEDFRFFKSKKSSDRKKTYTGMFNTYSIATIRQAMTYLIDTYSKDMDELTATGKSRGIRGVTNDKISKSMDTGIVYEGTINGILLYRKLKNSHNKVFYSLDLKGTIDKLIHDLYEDEEKRTGCHIYKNIEGYDVFCTLSGLIVVGKNKLREVLEKEIIARVLNRSTFIKIVTYEVGEKMLLSCTKELDYWVILDCFGLDYEIQFKRVTAKKVKEVVEC